MSATIDAATLRGRTDDELREMLGQATQSLYNLRFRKVTDVVENPAEFRKQRRLRARILTLLRERRNGTAPAAPAPAMKPAAETKPAAKPAARAPGKRKVAPRVKAAKSRKMGAGKK